MLLELRLRSGAVLKLSKGPFVNDGAISRSIEKTGRDPRLIRVWQECRNKTARDVPQAQANLLDSHHGLSKFRYKFPAVAKADDER